MAEQTWDIGIRRTVAVYTRLRMKDRIGFGGAPRQSCGIALMTEVKGDIRYSFSDGEIAVRRGDVLKFIEGERYSGRMHPDAYIEYIVVNFEADAEAFRRFSLPRRMSTVDYGEAWQLFTQLQEAFKAEDSLRDLQCRTLLYELLLRLARECTEQRPETMTDTLSPLLAYIREHCDDPSLSCDTLARLVFRSPSQLRRMWQRTYNCSPRDTIRDVRLSLARQLLRTSDIPIQSISDSCGFPDSSYFSRVFSARYGMSPRTFRTEGDRNALDTGLCPVPRKGTQSP